MTECTICPKWVERCAHYPDGTATTLHPLYSRHATYWTICHVGNPSKTRNDEYIGHVGTSSTIHHLYEGGHDELVAKWDEVVEMRLEMYRQSVAG